MASKSTFLPRTKKNHLQRGQLCEDQALEYYLRRKFLLVQRRWRSPFAEIDLVLRSPGGELVLVEVKSVPNFEFISTRMTSRQKLRLKRAVIFCAEREPLVRLELAVVSQQGEVLIFPDIFG